VVQEPKSQADYFTDERLVTKPSRAKVLLSRIAFPALAVMSREQTYKLGLTPIDDERVIMALKHAKGRVLDIGCGSNTFVRSHGNGTGVDVVGWKGCDVVVEDAASLPFEDGSYDTVSFLACLNHIPNREAAMQEALRVTKPGGQVLVTMIPPRLGAFIHWLRERNDPDHRERHIDHAHELMGMSRAHVNKIITDAGYKLPRSKVFVYGLNRIYIADKAK
jgi:SAM-dependent methyltransferase